MSKDEALAFLRGALLLALESGGLSASQAEVLYEATAGVK